MSGEVSTAQATTNLPGEDTWNRLRVCESGDNYSINTGNGYYGAYQFDLQTWRSVGGTGYPNQAAPLEQDRLARALYRSRGWSPWACARILGLQENPIYGYWTQPVSIRTQTSFVQGRQVTVSGTAQAGALVKVYGTYYGQVTPTLLATVRTGPRGGWTAYVHPVRTVSLKAVSGGMHSASVRATMLYRTTLTIPGSTVYNGSYAVSGKGHPGALVSVYVKPYNYSVWQSVHRVQVNGAGNWSMPWRGSTDYTFTVRGDTASTTRTVPVRTTNQGTTTSTTTTTATTTTATTAGAGVSVGGTARPNTAVTVYLRKTGTTGWTTFGTVRSDAHGHWSAVLSTAGQYQYYARSANGQASAVAAVTVS
jgi:hypothetical protein